MAATPPEIYNGPTVATGRSAKQNRDRIILYMSPLVILAGLFFLWTLIFWPVAAGVDKGFVGVVEGFIAGGVISPIIQYWYGSSKGSADKAEEMAKP